MEESTVATATGARATLTSAVAASLKLTEKIYEIRAVDRQARGLLETINSVNGQLDVAKTLRHQKSGLFKAQEKKYMDETFNSTEHAVSNVAKLVEPCRAALKTEGHIGMRTRLMFILRDSPRIEIFLQQLAIAGQSLNTVILLLFSRDGIDHASLTRTFSDLSEPPAYEESGFLTASRARNLLRRASSNLSMSNRRLMYETSPGVIPEVPEWDSISGETTWLDDSETFLQVRDELSLEHPPSPTKSVPYRQWLASPSQSSLPSIITSEQTNVVPRSPSQSLASIAISPSRLLRSTQTTQQPIGDSTESRDGSALTRADVTLATQDMSQRRASEECASLRPDYRPTSSVSWHEPGEGSPRLVTRYSSESAPPDQSVQQTTEDSNGTQTQQNHVLRRSSAPVGRKSVQWFADGSQLQQCRPRTAFFFEASDSAPTPLFHKIIKVDLDGEAPQLAQEVVSNASLEFVGTKNDEVGQELGVKRTPSGSAPEVVSIAAEVPVGMMKNLRRARSRRYVESKIRDSLAAPQVVEKLPLRGPENAPEVVTSVDQLPVPQTNSRRGSNASIWESPRITPTSTPKLLAAEPAVGRARSRKWQELQYTKFEQLPTGSKA